MKMSVDFNRAILNRAHDFSLIF